MTLRKITALLMAVSLAAPALSMAQDRHDDDHRPQQSRNDDRHAPPSRDAHPDMRGAGPDHAFRRGGRLPPEYRSRQYVVNDWRGHHLSAPPRGYQWVQTGGDYVLAAIATGVILNVLINQ